MEIDTLKDSFNDILERNHKEMEETMAKVKADKEKEKKEANSIKQELKERDQEIAKLKEELKVKQHSSEQLLLLSKCNEELKCSICDEIFIEPMALGCGHVYCRHCLEQWEVNCGNCFGKFNCPNCRQPITQFNKSLQLDNLISSLYNGLSETLQKDRENLVKERKTEELACKERQAAEKRQREQEQIEREQSRRRGRQTRRVDGIEIREIRETLRDQTRQQQAHLRELHAERRRNLQNRVRSMRDRLAVSEVQNTATDTVTNSPNTRSRVRNTVNEIRQRLVAEMTRRRSGANGASEGNLHVTPSRTRQGRQTEMTNSGARSIPVEDLTASPPAIDFSFSMADPPSQNSVVDMTEENEYTNDPDNAEDTVSSSQSSSTSESSSSNSSEPEGLGNLSDSSVEGIPGVYYGGYGECFNCGRRGHWAPGCPFNL